MLSPKAYVTRSEYVRLNLIQTCLCRTSGEKIAEQASTANYHIISRTCLKFSYVERQFHTIHDSIRNTCWLKCAPRIRLMTWKCWSHASLQKVDRRVPAAWRASAVTDSPGSVNLRRVVSLLRTVRFWEAGKMLLFSKFETGIVS